MANTEPFRLGPSDAARYTRLRLRMLTQAPWAFASSPEEDFALDVDRLTDALAEEQNAIFAIEAPNPASAAVREAAGTPLSRELIASAGIVRVQRAKSAHRAFIWGVYVEPDHRGAGHGRAVMTAALDLARGWPGVDYVDLGVSENSPGARRLYVSLGFKIWGREPAAIEHQGRRYDEIHMTLALNSAAAAKTRRFRSAARTRARPSTLRARNKH